MLLRLKKLSRRKKYHRQLWIIPYFFTFLNAIFGFLSIIRAFEGNYKAAAYYIIIAAILDGFDGKLARAFDSTSYFGMELDSLCDAISFCLAPTVLVCCWAPFDGSAKLVVALYLCAGLARLAKFNITAEKQYDGFIGLPTTIAASFIASLVLYHPWLAVHHIDFMLHKYLLLMLMLALSFLMVSPIRFVSFKRYALTVPHDYYKIALAIVLLVWLTVYRWPLLLCILGGYIGSNIGMYGYRCLKTGFSANRDS